jgi:hypothetical protein
MKLTGENRSTRGKSYPSATLSTTNPTWTDPGSNPGLRGGRPQTNHLSHGTALLLSYSCLEQSAGRYEVLRLRCVDEFALIKRKLFTETVGCDEVTSVSSAFCRGSNQYKYGYFRIV